MLELAVSSKFSAQEEIDAGSRELKSPRVPPRPPCSTTPALVCRVVSLYTYVHFVEERIGTVA